MKKVYVVADRRYRDKASWRILTGWGLPVWARGLWLQMWRRNSIKYRGYRCGRLVKTLNER